MSAQSVARRLYKKVVPTSGGGHKPGPAGGGGKGGEAYVILILSFAVLFGLYVMCVHDYLKILEAQN